MHENHLKIAVFLPSHLPVPAVCGGAVETIIQNLIEENEKEHLFDFTVFSSFDERAYQLSRKYKNTKMVYTKVNNSLDDLYYLCYRFFKKVFKIALPDRISRIKMICGFDSTKYDYILFQAGEVFCLHRYKNILDSKKLIVHGHGMITPIKSVDPLFSYYLAISDFVAQYWKSGSDRAENTYKTLHNCIDVAKFNKNLTDKEKISLRKKLGISKKDFIVLFTGRIIPEKGVYELIDSLKYIDNDSIKLMIVGSAEFEKKTLTAYEKAVFETAKTYPNRIIFTGYVPNDQLYHYYNISNIAVVPSKWDEPAGLVVLEAMAAGKAVITTGTGGIREFINSECALFISREETMSKEIADAINYFFLNPEKAEEMGKIAQMVANKYSMKNYLHNLRHILSEIQGVND